MILEIGLIVVGIPLGYAVHKKKAAVSATNHALSGIIYTLLFLIGLSLGSNEDLLARVGELGIQGVIIGILSALGSVFAVCFLFRSFFGTALKNVKNTPQCFSHEEAQEKHGTTPPKAKAGV